MTSVAVKPGVSTRQRKMRLFTVIEAPKRPAIRIVAGLARAPQPAFMMGIGMARLAVFSGALELGRGVAALTGHSGVQPDQGEAGHVVVEHDFLAPALFVVTAFAFIAELALVGVLLFVARDACGFQLVLVEIAGVAAFTCHLAMLAS